LKQGRGKTDSSEDREAAAIARVLAAGGRLPKKFVKARPASAGPTLAAAQSQAKITPARRVAFEILTLVAAQEGHSDDLLHGARTQDLSEADRNLATALVMGVLRWQIALDAQIATLLQRPDQKLDESVALALRLGAFQLLHMDRIPAHAALSESVELCRAAGHPHASGMVNAVLRKLAVAKPAGVPVYESTAAFAQRLAHPEWLVARWVALYGREAAIKICEADQAEPASGGLYPEPDAKLPSMDDGSRLVAEIAAAALPVGGSRIWDCCAAPGGKTLMLAARTSAEILATDVSPKRLVHMQARLRRFEYACRIRTSVADATSLDAGEGNFDLILCDVPCSGTGTLARNPEIRLRLRPDELVRQATRQREILCAALTRLAPGGRLVYSTCSLEPEENEEVIAAVVSGLRRIPVDSLGVDLPLAGLVRDGALRTLPGVNPCDGFFAAVVERNS
jgi:16S rRNA (cytosine967-C5)-methyltransferase